MTGKTQASPAVRAILRRLGLERASGLERMPGGSSTQVWQVPWAGRPAMLRVYPAGTHQAQEREGVLLRHVGQHGLPVPAVHAAGVEKGVPYLLLSVCAGHPVGQEIRHRPWRAYALGVQVGLVHAALHRLPVPDALRPFRHQWRHWLAERPRVCAVLQAADRLQDSLLHLDLHPYNILTDGDRVTGVVDWISGAVGDPRHDVARTLVLLRCPRTDRSLTAPAIRAVSRLYEVGWLHGYRQGSLPALRRALNDRATQAAFLACASLCMAAEMRGVRRQADLLHLRRLSHRWERSAARGGGRAAPPASGHRAGP